MRKSFAAAAVAALTLTAAFGGVADAAPALVKPTKVITSTASAVVESYNYAGTTNVDQELDAYYDPSESGRPWVVVVHGGSWAAGGRVNEAKASDVLFAAGFNVFNVAYRLTTDYAGNPGTAWPAQRTDVLKAIDYVKANATQFGIDADRGALYGFSAGGHVAASAGLYGNGGARVKAIVSVSGVLQPHRVQDVADSDPATGHGGDFPTDGNKVLAKWAAVATRCPHLTTWTDCNTRWNDFLPEKQISSDDPPMMILQGTADQSVPQATANAFAYWLTKAGVENTVTLGQDWAHTENLFLGNDYRQAQVINFLKAKTA